MANKRSGAILFMLFFPTALGLSEEMQELADMLHATCVGETGASDNDIEKARIGDFSEDEKLKCYMMCIMAQMACIDEDGIIDVDATIAVLPEELQDVAGPIVRKCDTQKGANPCENAWLTNKCYYNENPEGLTKEEMDTLGKQIHDTCVAKTGVSEDLIAAVNNDKTFAHDENLKCYIKCIMQEGGIMDDEGVVDVETTLEVIPEEYKKDIEPIIRACGTQTGSTPCENAWLTQKCYARYPQYRLI